MLTSDAMNAARSEPCSANSATTPTAKQASVVAYGRDGRPSDGLRSSPTVPRAPTPRENSVIATTISRNGSASGSPCCGSQGNTDSSFVISDCSMPSARPAAAATPNDVKRATSATPSAGTMNSVYEVGSTVETGAMRMPAIPASSVASTQLPAPIRSADNPTSAAPCWFSALARVARPKRV